jgi:hypothetical protein
MDKVRFGRALGYGARHAAKAVAEALDAATTPDPTPAARRPAGTSAGAVGVNSADRVVRAAGQVMQAHSAVHGAVHGAGRELKAEAVRQVSAGAKGRGKAIWSPVARLSGVLWLEVTGTFFAVLALYLSQGLWKQRGMVAAGWSSGEAGKYYLHAVAFAVFAYFAVSSFVRARRRGQRA